MKFKFNVVQEVEVELDEAVFDEQYFKDFSEFMWDVEELKDIAEYVARHKALYDGYAIEFVPEGCYTAKIVDDYVEEA